MVFINVRNHRSDTSPGTTIIKLQSQTLSLETHMEKDLPLWAASNKLQEKSLGRFIQ